MVGPRAVKPVDSTMWIPLLAEYRRVSLAFENVLVGTLLPHLDPASPEVIEALESWPGQAYLDARARGTHIVLVYPAARRPRRWPWMHVALFAATLLTTLGAGALMVGRDPFGTEVLRIGGLSIPYPSTVDWSTLALGAPFAIPFLVVLLAHELSHYLAARRHRVRATLPYFVPFPPYFSIIGTLGAFIRLLGPTVRRATLFDIGASGPLASFILSLPLFAIGLAWSEPIPGASSLATPFALQFSGQVVWLGNGLLTHLLASWLAPVSVGETLLLLHPLALVGWLGLFVTKLNLLPLGQLDGGHILYALAPERHTRVARVFLYGLILAGLVWWGWWAWAVLVLVVNRGRLSHPRVLQHEPSIGRFRRVLGWLLILMFLFTFVPMPVRL